MSISLSMPPFGGVILAYQKESIKLGFPLYIFVGKDARQEAINHKRMGVLCTYLPYGEDYAKYAWPIENQSVVIMDSGFNSVIALKRMCHYLLYTYTPRAVTLFSENAPIQIFKRSAK